jgi:hypothetical protein
VCTLGKPLVLMSSPCCQSLRSNRLVVSEYEVPKVWFLESAHFFVNHPVVKYFLFGVKMIENFKIVVLFPAVIPCCTLQCSRYDSSADRPSPQKPTNLLGGGRIHFVRCCVAAAARPAPPKWPGTPARTTRLRWS